MRLTLDPIGLVKVASHQIGSVMRSSPEWLTITAWHIWLLYLPFHLQRYCRMRGRIHIFGQHHFCRRENVLCTEFLAERKLFARVSYVVGESDMRPWCWLFRYRCCNWPVGRNGSLIVWWSTVWRSVKINHSRSFISCPLSHHDATYKDTDCAYNNTHNFCRMHLVGWQVLKKYNWSYDDRSKIRDNQLILNSEIRTNVIIII